MSVPRRKSKVKPPPAECPLASCMRFIAGTWTPNIIWFLTDSPRRFTELKEDVVGISPKMLTARLKRLEADGVIERKVMDTSPPTVEYSLTELGHEITPVLNAIIEVGKKIKEYKQK